MKLTISVELSYKEESYFDQAMLNSVKPGPEDNCHFNDQTFFSDLPLLIVTLY